MRRAAVLAAAVLLLAATAATAQTPFVLRNIGQRVETDDARMVARGFGMAVTDSLHPGFKNLASLSSLRHVVVAFTGYGESADNTGPGDPRRVHRVFTPEIRVGAPVIKNRLAVTAGFSLFRSGHYETREEAEWYAWGDTLRGFRFYERQGSLFDVPLGVALRPFGELRLGGTLNLVRGTLDEATENAYVTPSAGGTPLYLPSRRVDNERYDGTSYTLAALWAPFAQRVRFAAAWTPAYDVNVQREVELVGVAERERSEHVMRLPAEYRAGVQARLAGRWVVGGDVRYQDFGDFRGVTTDERDWAAEMTEEYEYSFGIERVRGTERRRPWSNLPLRLGYAFRRWGYEIGGEPVEQSTFSVGTGFPFRRDMGQLDVAVSYSLLGDRATNGYESRIWRLTVSVTGLEEWW